MTDFHNRVERLTEIRAAEKLQESTEEQPLETHARKPWKRKLKPYELPPDPEKEAKFAALLEQRRAAIQARFNRVPGQSRGIWSQPLPQRKEE